MRRKVLWVLVILVATVCGWAVHRRYPGVAEPATLLVADKHERTLTVYAGAKVLKVIPIAIGMKDGPKQHEGDLCTPEGHYYVTDKDGPPHDCALWLSYPNDRDAARGVQQKLISPQERAAIVGATAHKGIPPQFTRLGGGIAIHGGGVRGGRWTSGCLGANDADLYWLIATVPAGTPIDIH